jgi:glycerol-3-phosphate dehydrogenase
MIGGDFDRYVAVHSEGQAQRLGLDRQLIAHLIQVYGSRYSRVLTLIERRPELAARVSPEHPDVMAQVVYAVEHEDARTLADVMLRRLTAGMSAGRGRDGVEAVAALLAALLGWDAARQREELAAWEEQIAQGAPPDLDPPAAPAPLAAAI